MPKITNASITASTGQRQRDTRALSNSFLQPCATRVRSYAHETSRRTGRPDATRFPRLFGDHTPTSPRPTGSKHAQDRRRTNAVTAVQRTEPRVVTTCVFAGTRLDHDRYESARIEPTAIRARSLYHLTGPNDATVALRTANALRQSLGATVHTLSVAATPSDIDRLRRKAADALGVQRGNNGCARCSATTQRKRSTTAQTSWVHASSA